MRVIWEFILIPFRFLRAVCRYWNRQNLPVNIRFVIAFGIAFGLYWWDPVGAGTYTKQATTALISTILSPTVDDTARDEISIVLFDDKFVQENDWPVEFSVHAKALKKIATFNPAAIYVDLLLIETAQRKDWLTLRLTLTDLERRGIPVFLAAAQTRRNPVHQGFLQIPSSHKDGGPVSNLVGTGYNPATAWLSYDLAPQFTNSSISPALALFQAYCSKVGHVKDPNRACDSKELQAPVRLLKDLYPLALVWGLTPSEANKGAFKCNENLQPPNPSRFLDSNSAAIHVARQLWNLIFLDKREREETCPRYPTILYENLMSDFGTPNLPTVNGVAVNVGNRIVDPTPSPLKSYFENKIVIYGSDIEGSSVFVDPPTHQLLPTPYMHATALEGLLRDGDDYLRLESGIFGLSFPLTGSELLAIALLTYLYAKTVRPERVTVGLYQSGQHTIFRSGLIPTIIVGLTIWLILLFTLSSIAALQLYTNNIFPFDVIGLFAVILLLRGFRYVFVFRSIEFHMLKFGRRVSRTVRSWFRKN
jgi:hypothetical protein